MYITIAFDLVDLMAIAVQGLAVATMFLLFVGVVCGKLRAASSKAEATTS